MKHIIRISISILTICLTACNTDETEKPGLQSEQSLADSTLSLSETIRKSTGLKRKEDVLHFYEDTQYKLIWSDDSSITNPADSLFYIFSNSRSYGLDASHYHFPRLRDIRVTIADGVNINSAELLEWELLMTDAWFTFGKHLAEGLIDTLPEDAIIPRNRLLTDQVELLKQACSTNSQASALLALQPDHPEYHKLQRALAAYIKINVLTDSSVTVPSFKTDSILAYKRAIKALQHIGYLDKDSAQPVTVQEAINNIQTTYNLEADDKSIQLMQNIGYFDIVVMKTKIRVREAIKRFQTMYGLTADGKIGANTAAALSESNLTRYKKAAVCLEQWRRTKAPTGYHIIINIPAFTLNIYNNDSLKKTHKVIVGNPKAHTPILKSRLEYFITYPFWYVPHGIATKELLPKIKNDSTYLERNNFEVLGKGKRVIDPCTIDWKKMNAENFPYMLRQKGGSTNSLGLIKFMFPNKHSVYLHDTPTKSLFKTDIRTFSHGCIRLQNPLDLAEYLLKSDNNHMVIDTVVSLISRGESKVVVLNKPVPFYVLYLTCTGSEDGSITFHRDIYGYEQKLMKYLFPEK